MKHSNNRESEYKGTDLEAMENANNQNEWILNEFRPYLGKQVCEVGAGQGNLTSLLLSEKIDSLTSFEPSENMFVRLEKTFPSASNFNPVNQSLSEEPDQWKGAFDSITYINVLEHIEDDKKELRHAFGCLKENGYLLIFVPALSWLYSSFDREIGHYRRYHKNNLVSITQIAQFNIVQAKYVDMLGIVPWYIFLVLLRQNLSPTGVSLYNKLITPLARKIESVVPPPLGKNLLLIAQKKSR